VDFLRQLPIGQFVAEEESQVGAAGAAGSWLRRLDPRLKLAWTLAFLVTPILAGPLWRLALVGLLLLITAVSGLPWRLWRRSLPLLLAVALLVGGLAAFLPAGGVAAGQLQRPPAEVRLDAGSPLQSPPEWAGQRWQLWQWGPLEVTRRSAELGLNGATLLVTLVHSANLLLVSTPPEELVWAISWGLQPLARLGWPVERLGFTLLLALRFLPLVQEELQNLVRALATRAVNFRALGWKAGLGLVLAVGERLLANLLLRAEQGAEALVARGGRWLAPDQLRLPPPMARRLNGVAGLLLLVLIALRWKLGGL
jgi:energy-coupling factor transport system permease protein